MTWKIVIKNLTLSPIESDEPLIKNFSMKLGPKESIALKGPTGSGKTTLALALMDLLDPSFKREGELSFLGQAKNWKIGQEKAMMFQDPHRALNPFLNVQGHLRAMRKNESYSLFYEKLREVSLPSTRAFLKKFPHELSGGEKQRLLLLMALWGKPQLLIADEPTTSLDLPLKRAMIRLLKALQKERGFTLLVLSHDEETLFELSKQQIELRRSSAKQ